MMHATKKQALLRREFEKVLKAAGAGKGERVGAASSLRPETIERLLPWWRRLKLRFSK